MRRTASNGEQWADLLKFFLTDTDDNYTLDILEADTGIPDSTLKRKMDHLVRAGLFTTHRQGWRKQIVYVRAGKLA